VCSHVEGGALLSGSSLSLPGQPQALPQVRAEGTAWNCREMGKGEGEGRQVRFYACMWIILCMYVDYSMHAC